MGDGRAGGEQGAEVGTAGGDAATASAVIVPVPRAEPVVGAHRRTLDRSASWGVPAHVTVLYPFVHPARITAEVLAALGAAVGDVPAFDCAFTRVRWFGAEVVWLEPAPETGFRALTTAVCRRFPDHLPFGGRYDDAVPHLTVADARVAPAAAMRRAAEQVRAGLPFTARVDRVWLVAGRDAPGSWRSAAEFPLPAAD